MNYYLIGMMGSGKSTVGKLLAKKLETPFLDLDHYIEVKNKMSIQDIFKEKAYFESSENNLGIQIADFCAFIISRSQWIMMNKKGGEDFGPDKHILGINSKLNHWNPDIQYIKGDENFMSKEGFEFFMKRDRQKKGLSKL